MMTTIPYVGPRYLSCAETAKLVRGALKKAFPGQKFSVKSKTYSGGASITVSWKDGPTTKAVDRVVGVYSGADFDGSIDLKCSTRSWLEPDGTAYVAHAQGTQGSMGYLPEMIGDPQSPNAELVHFGADYVFTNRDVSDEWSAAIFGLFGELVGRDLGDPSVDPWTVWDQKVPLSVGSDGELYRMVDSEQHYLREVFHRFVGPREGGNIDRKVVKDAVSDQG